MTIVMGLDQHRAQVTADWLDSETGEVSRARVMPTDRAQISESAAGIGHPGCERRPGEAVRSALVLPRPRHRGEDERGTTSDHNSGDLTKVFHATECCAIYVSSDQGRLKWS